MPSNPLTNKSAGISLNASTFSGVISHVVSLPFSFAVIVVGFFLTASLEETFFAMPKPSSVKATFLVAMLRNARSIIICVFCNAVSVMSRASGC